MIVNIFEGTKQKKGIEVVSCEWDNTTKILMQDGTPLCVVDLYSLKQLLTMLSYNTNDSEVKKAIELLTKELQ